ncbi:hypothetical protein HELRODRAFT_65958 [Helobdella robusta]|uniref:SS18 N-terminal domain-containing protein n=1 Tax=Helobdella robusta TaxID=6412 RepID=T1FYF1_HELRO|nr:hypothetical protein HELRODRAFT_65958 [Helobdella robusta]ESO02450.1 hypothetical protein HELRODRAFT_65958 [Helobdella robusta]
MSLAFMPNPRTKAPPPNQASIQKMLDENSQFIQTIIDFQNKGRGNETIHYQQLLHKNLVYLATIADNSQNVQNLLPPVGYLLF